MTTPNKFRLNTLLKIRKNKEKIIQKELGECYCLQNQAMAHKMTLHHAQVQLSQDFKMQVHKEVDARILNEINQYTMYLKQQEVKVDEEIVQIDETIAMKKSDLREAVKDKKILENLEQRYFEQWLEEQKEIEQKQLDEIISYRYTTNQEEGENG